MNDSRPRRTPFFETAILLLTAALIFSTAGSSPAAKKSGRPKVVADASYVHDLLEAPVPNYPEEAVRKGWSGVGVFEIQFQPNGTAKDVVVVLTTGHELLDRTARAALLHWRCKPRAERNVRVTLSFTTGEGLVKFDDNEEDGAKKRGNLTAAARPRYPYEARRQGEGGFGVFVIRFTDDGTASKVVVLKSTGSLLLDNETILTLRKWRCRPGVYTTIMVPITYTPGTRRR